MQEGRPRKKPGDSYTKQHSGGAPKGGFAARLRQGLSPTQVKICLAAAGVLVVLIVIMLVFALTAGGAQPASSSAVSLPAVATSATSAPVSQPDSVDQAAFSQALGEYADVLLPETPDAGADYAQDTLFLGDSNTARMVMSNAASDVSMENAIGIESMGITSVLGLRCVRFSGHADMTIPNAVALMQPRRIVINFGTNNAGLNTKNFTDSYRTAIEAIQEKWPYADIFIASVFPITQNCSYGGITMKHIEEFNTALLGLAKDMDLRFLNWSEALKDPASGYCQPRFMTADGVHLSDAGLTAVLNYFRNHSYEGEDTRPKPLQAVPRRLPTPEGLFPKPQSSSKPAANSSSLPSGSSSVPAAPATITVPNYANAQAAGWTVVETIVANDGSYTEGQVLGQSPAEGTQAAAVGTITVSRAGPPIPPPPPSSSPQPEPQPEPSSPPDSQPPALPPENPLPENPPPQDPSSEVGGEAEGDAAPPPA